MYFRLSKKFIKKTYTKKDYLRELRHLLTNCRKPSISRATLYNYINRYEKAKDLSKNLCEKANIIVSKRQEILNELGNSVEMEDVKGGK